MKRFRMISNVAPAVGALLLALLAGCVVTRVDPPPPAEAPAQFKETGIWQRAVSAPPVPDEWWQLFNDPVLDGLQRRLVIGNESLKSAAAQVASARAAAVISESM